MCGSGRMTIRTSSASSIHGRVRPLLGFLVALGLAAGPETGWGVVSSAQAIPSAGAIERLAREGDKALDERRWADALGAFSEAVTLAPRDASLRFGAGYAAAMLGRLADSRAWLEGALTLQPRFIQASTVLGQVLYRQGKVAEAIAAYEAALKYAPNDEAITTLLDKWRREVKVDGRFYETRGAHFSVMFEGPADDAGARRVVEILEQAYFRIGRTLSTYPSDPIVVVLYTRQQFTDVTRSPAWAGGAYDGRIKIPIVGAFERTAELRRILEHEFVHALVASVAGSAVPVWLNEGLAAALEPGDLQWATDVLKAESHRLSYAQLEGNFGRLSTREAAIAYAQSALAVKRLLDLRGPSAIVTLLQSLGNGTPFPSAFQAAMLMRLDEFQVTIARL